MNLRNKILELLPCWTSSIALSNDDSLAKITQNSLSDIITLSYLKYGTWLIEFIGQKRN